MPDCEQPVRVMLEAVVVRADGSREELGVVSERVAPRGLLRRLLR